MATSYPLQWPEGWQRTTHRRRAAYKVTIGAAYEHLRNQLGALGARRGSIVVSSNVRVANGGAPVNDGFLISDPGVAAYWTDDEHGERAVACDRWDSVRGNMRALGLGMQGLRALERAGASQILARAFTAFGALPPSPNATPARPWWEVFGFEVNMLTALSLPVIEARYRERVTKAHPDRGGSAAEFGELSVALQQAREHFK